MMEDFSGLALPPLFGGNILEAELETEGVEFVDGGGVSEEPGAELREEAELRERERRKYQALSRRCKELEQVNERILARLHQVCWLTRRLKKERRFLMKTLTSYGDDFRSAQLTLLLEEEGGALADFAHCREEEGLHEPPGSSPSSVLQPAAGPRKKRHRSPRERDRELQAEPQFSGYPSPPAHSLPDFS